MTSKLVSLVRAVEDRTSGCSMLQANEEWPEFKAMRKLSMPMNKENSRVGLDTSAFRKNIKRYRVFLNQRLIFTGTVKEIAAKYNYTESYVRSRTRKKLRKNAYKIQLMVVG